MSTDTLNFERAASPREGDREGPRGGTKRLFTVAAVFQLLHLSEEALGSMHDDPIIVAAYQALAPLGPRHAAYLVFQLTFALALVACLMVDRGGGARRLFLGLLALAQIAEGHHLVRALWSLAPNPGLLTSLPLPILGVLILRRAIASGGRPADVTYPAHPPT